MARSVDSKVMIDRMAPPGPGETGWEPSSMSPVKKEMGQRSRAVRMKQLCESSGGAGEGISGCEVQTDLLAGPSGLNRAALKAAPHSPSMAGPAPFPSVNPSEPTPV